ncbi:cupin-like domain-containing protein [Streptomyces sp. AN091965]|uniref:cupin-like domain-containing protein n=1 Tax=Streptomyces sp. AN091965 TaxID=2927803 RepID=UPI001F6170AA|nr:cupin-like domain-containing protein [Streptomyces sp. AN091965]MCI3934370.1 cupin domain-containing protein [Streptomyces sp. AN091965]
MTLDLETLVAPLTAAEFLDRNWPGSPYTTDGDPERLAELAAVPALASNAAVLDAYRATVSLLRTDGVSARVPDGPTAAPLLAAGFTCYLRRVEEHIPQLRAMAEAVAHDLGMPATSVTCEIFCSADSSGVSMHSDHDVNFALLLRGHKRWRLAPNEHIRNQTGVCLPGNRRQREEDQLALADRLPFPDRLPDDALSVDVGAGGLVFLPRGWWHETQAQGECLQVNFVVKGPDWTSVLVQALTSRLTGDPRWRAHAYDVCAAGERGERAAAVFADLLKGLSGDFAAADPADLAERLLADSGLLPADRAGVR